MEENNTDYIMLCEKYQNIVESRILALQQIRMHIKLLDELNYFGDSGVRFSDDFVETEFSKWKDCVECWMTTAETGEPYCMFNYVATLFPQIPFEKAYRYKNPEYHNASDELILREVFGDYIEWRKDPSVIEQMNSKEREKIYKHFEYMLYYIINTKQELAYDIQTSL